MISGRRTIEKPSVFAPQTLVLVFFTNFIYVLRNVALLRWKNIDDSIYLSPPVSEISE